jgi:hypothetical protein
MRPRAAPGVVIGVACVLVTGCGSSATEQVRAKVQQFAVAVAHRDAKTICTDVFAPSLVTRFKDAGLTCQRGLGIFFSGVHHPTLAVGQVKVHGSKASAMTLSGASGQTASLRTVDLVMTSNGWRIAAVGAPVSGSSGAAAQQGTTKGKTATGPTTTATRKRAPTTTKRTPTATKKRTPPKPAPAKKGSTSTKP